MRERVKGALLVVLLVLVGVVGERTYHTWRWAGEVNWKVAQVYGYLAGVVGKTPDGRPITRADLLEAQIQQVLRAAQAAPPPPKKEQ